MLMKNRSNVRTVILKVQGKIMYGNMNESILMKNHIYVVYVTKSLGAQKIWGFTKESTQARDHIGAQSVIRSSKIHQIWRNMREFTQVWDHLVALNVVSHSNIMKVWGTMKKLTQMLFQDWPKKASHLLPRNASAAYTYRLLFFILPHPSIICIAHIMILMRDHFAYYKCEFNFINLCLSRTQL